MQILPQIITIASCAIPTASDTQDHFLTFTVSGLQHTDHADASRTYVLSPSGLNEDVNQV